LLELSLPHILVSLVGSGIGYVYLSYGRTQADWSLITAGLGLMTYSYFVSELIWLVAVGGAIGVAPFLCRRES
jgi:hypothetical protein